jgi:hypothetical protein
MAGIDSYTKFMLHMNTNFEDSSDSVHTMVVGGDAQISNAEFKWTASGLFDGIGDFVYSANNIDFNFGSGDFTIDFWCFPLRFSPDVDTLLTIDKATLHTKNNYGIDIVIDSNCYVYSYVSNGTSEWYCGSSGESIKDKWSHIALVRSGNNILYFINGSLNQTTIITGSINFDLNFSLNIGTRTGGSVDPYNGYIDELRISKGIARWTSNFPVPTEEYIRYVPVSGLTFPTLSMLPTYPLKEDREDSVIKTKSEEGYQVARRKYDRVRRKYSVPFKNLTNMDVGLVRTFYNTDTDGGELLFNWLHPVSLTTLTVTFVKPPIFNVEYYGNTYKYSTEVEFIEV